MKDSLFCLCVGFEVISGSTKTTTMSKIIVQSQVPESYFEEDCFIAELLNTPDCPGLSIARARVEPGVSTVLHRVRGADEIYYLLSGEGQVEMDGQIIGTMHPGDLLRIPADATQRITNTGREDLIFLAICTPRFEPGRYEAVTG